MSTLPHTAWAQESAPAPAATVPKQDKMDKVPDEYIEEANSFYDECAGNYFMGQYYNCECLSLAYLDERIDGGPTMEASRIKQNITNECRDAIGAAGPIYQKCLQRANRFNYGTDPEIYCECVANTYVKTISRDAPSINSKSMVSYQSYAYNVCNNPNDRR